MKKKLLSTLICMTITVGMLPTTAYATEDGTEIENQQFITPEQPGATQIPTMAYATEDGTEIENQQVITPDQPGATQIPTSYMVYCEDHGLKEMNLIWDTLTIGKVTDSDGGYVCPITIATNAYAEEYSKDTKHTAVEKTITYNMTWTGSEWKAPEMTQLPVINVKCEKEVVPAAPGATQIPTSYTVFCEDHGPKEMNLIRDTFTIGKVTGSDGSYVCPITIATNAYAEKYSTATNKKHKAAEKTITYNMTWTGTEWKAPEMTQLPEIRVKCEKEVVPAAPKANELPMRYMVKCTKRSLFHRVRFITQLPKTVTIGKVKKNGNNYVCKISVSTESYAKAYSKEVHKLHTAIKRKITYQMTWDGKQWAYSNFPTIEVACAR